MKRRSSPSGRDGRERHALIQILPEHREPVEVSEKERWRGCHQRLRGPQEERKKEDQQHPSPEPCHRRERAGEQAKEGERDEGCRWIHKNSSLHRRW